MNNKKVSFIYCVNDYSLFAESIEYIKELTIPEGFEIEVIPVEDAPSTTSGYNYAMKSSDAKYKVYLHDDVFIINKAFIIEMLEIFQQNLNIGMMGLVGSTYLPANGAWEEVKTKCGKVYNNQTGQMSLLEFDEIVDNYQPVLAIDGFVMMTQYDFEWREDLFKGWDFYNVSQSLELKRRGYQSVIPKQKKAWCIHDCGINKHAVNDLEREKFLKEYSKDIYPLVSILIPTYNRVELFQLALESVIKQSYKNIEIIIGDDSTNNETEQLVKEYYLNNYSNITYYHNEKNLGQFDNDLKLFNLANGEFVNYLMDDDLFEVNKIEKMMNYFIQDFNNEIALVTSYRGIIDGMGNKKGVFGETDQIFKNDSILHGIDLGNLMLKHNFNCVGEPTTALFRKNLLKEEFGVLNGRKYGCNVDQASWLNLLSKGKGVIIAEVLSYFRIHDSQQLGSPKMKILGAVDYAHEILTANLRGFLDKDDDKKEAITNCILYCKKILNEFKELDLKELRLVNEYTELEDFVNELHSEYNPSQKKTLINKTEVEELPLVSILIPAYNQTHFLKEALESAINQTYSNIEIIIGDDSTTNDVEKFIDPYLKDYKNIKYFKNHGNKMDYGISNANTLLEKCNGEFVNYLFHDDIFHPTKIERMMNCFFQNPTISLVTSARQPIDEKGNFLTPTGAFIRLFESDTIISGQDLSMIVIKNLSNFIGEPSSVLFKRKYIEEYGTYNEVQFWSIADIAIWFTLLQYGDAVYISDTLSYFRVHENQNSNSHLNLQKGLIDWNLLIHQSFVKGILHGIDEYKEILCKWITMFTPLLPSIIKDLKEDEVKFKDEIKKIYNETIDNIVYLNIEDRHECPNCGNIVERFIPYQYLEHKSDFFAKYKIVGSDTENHTCPRCLCNDRLRHLILFFNRLNIWNKHIVNKKVLHIAPEIHLKGRIHQYNPQNYVCGDLYPIDESIEKIDITNIQFEDNYFDFIICNHVLEHIPDDLKAMSELYRVLNNNGYALLQTPYSPEIYESFQDSNINTSKLREIYYGQADHVRIYGLDFFEKLASVGFKLQLIYNKDFFSKEECEKYGINYKEDLILVKKIN